MFSKHHYILLGILSLCLSYIMFTNQQYFSPLAMLGLFALAIVAVAFFLIPHIYPDRLHDKRIFLALGGILLLTALLEYGFDLVPPNALSSIGYEALLLAISTCISILGVHFLAKKLKKEKGFNWYVPAIAGAIIIALAAYSIMYIFNSVQWNGVDEVAYNYYAASLFINGQNPYSTSMQPIIAQRNIQSTVQLGGTYEYSYDYPALSFLPFVFLPLLGITNFLSFTYLTILFAIFSSLILYKKSDLNKHLLIPIAGWLVASYALVGVASQYLAVPIFLLLAYLYRQRPIVCGVFMGLAASTIQLTWFALPFLLILLFKENGLRKTATSAVAALIVFATINAYFVLTSPMALGSIFGIFGLSSLVFYGINIMQFMLAFYALPYWYAALVSIVLFIVTLVLFYLYAQTLKPLLAIVPMMIFFLAWRNIIIYALPFVPLLLAIYYWPDHHKHKDLVKSKRYILPALTGVVAIGIVAAIVAHNLYVNSNSLQISSALPVIGVQNSYYSQTPIFGLLGLKVTVNNTFGTAENVSFYVVSRSPYGEQYFLSQNLNKSMEHSLTNYTLNYPLQLIGKSTQIEIFAFSKDYIASRQLNFTNLGSGFSPR